MKKVFIINGTGASGKDTFVSFTDKYIPTCKYSIIDLVKEAAIILGCDTQKHKTEKDRKFLSDIMDLASKYNDSPYEDVKSFVRDFKQDYVEGDVLFVDMRDPSDISRAVQDFNAKTILVRNPKKNPITSNHADANVEHFTYDYIIENDGTLEDLDEAAKMFVYEITQASFTQKHSPIIFYCNEGREAVANG